MARRSLLALAALPLIAGTLAVPAAAAPPEGQPPGQGLDVYTGEIARGQLGELVDLGIDRHELSVQAVPGERGRGAQVRVEAILSAAQAQELRGKGVRMQPKEVDGATVAERATVRAAQGHEVWRTYAGAGGLQEEFLQAAEDNPTIAKAVTVGQSVNGQDIVAVKVSKNATRMPDGQRPATLYLGAQHAREWITPEMVRRLMHRVLNGYGTDPVITRLIDTTELWFLPVANPDGYDFTFEPGQRLWRKNLRDNNGDGTITPGDGVDLNRNFPTKWGYDDEGSSPSPGSDTYRGPSAGSEPETQVLDAFVGSVGFEFVVNYHSAAELILYGVGWQVATPTPDDVIYEAMVGDDEESAVPGYDPDISAELYTTNGDTDTHLQEAHGTLGFTPEMATCESASDSVEGDEWLAEDCGSGFEFPDDEQLVQAEFERNVPFALAVGASAADPDDPVSVVGRTAEDFRVDTFEVSHGVPQPVAVWAKRALLDVRMEYRIDGGPTQTTKVAEWTGGERYGDDNDDYYAELRGEVVGGRPGSQVEVWFTGVKPGTGPVSSERFTYRVASDVAGDVLVIANEDYTGVNPDYPPSVTAPKYAAAHVAAVKAAGRTADVWDVDAQGVPHDLGVLSHYDAVLWYLGDNRISQDPEDELTSTPFGQLPDLSVKETQQYLTIAVRDYLNAGGKLLHAGETAQYSGLPGISDVVGGLYYGLDGDPTAECVIEPQVNSETAGFFGDCLILADDFRQYWLGAYSRTDVSGPKRAVGTGAPVDGVDVALDGGDNPLDEAGSFVPTSDVLPVEQFPQFASRGVVEYGFEASGPGAFEPVEGDWYVGVEHQDASYTRLTRTVDVPSGSSASLEFQLSANTEAAYDFVLVEARTPGQEDWRTLPEANGLTSDDVPADCAGDDFLLRLHPFLRTYLDAPGCSSSKGTWHAVTGVTDGWEQVEYDLSSFAGSQVELSISYVTDPAFGGVGAFVDDTRVVVDGAPTLAEGFESGLGAWTVGGAPAGSPPTAAAWERSQQLVFVYGGTATQDTLLLGFGLEQVPSAEERATLVRRALDGLLG